jgi:hypothetical protein
MAQIESFIKTEALDKLNRVIELLTQMSAIELRLNELGVKVINFQVDTKDMFKDCMVKGERPTTEPEPLKGY